MPQPISSVLWGEARHFTGPRQLPRIWTELIIPWDRESAGSLHLGNPAAQPLSWLLDALMSWSQLPRWEVMHQPTLGKKIMQFKGIWLAGYVIGVPSMSMEEHRFLQSVLRGYAVKLSLILDVTVLCPCGWVTQVCLFFFFLGAYFPGITTTTTINLYIA